MKVFKGYAKFYDLLYKDKDYQRECRFLEKIFSEYSKRKIKDVLDFGCGTGNHDFILEKRGYNLVGVDASKKMIGLAREKKERMGSKIRFLNGDIRKIKLKKRFDALISMFAVISYQTKNRDLASAFANASRHLKKGGLLIFDCWSGMGVISQKPQKRKKVIKKNGEMIIRKSTPYLDLLAQTIDVRFELIRTLKGKVLEKVNEIHKMRYLFPQEIFYFLEEKGFKVLKISPFMNLSKPLSERDWDMIVIAKKI